LETLKATQNTARGGFDFSPCTALGFPTWYSLASTELSGGKIPRYLGIALAVSAKSTDIGQHFGEQKLIEKR
jgi:hypothetical protein